MVCNHEYFYQLKSFAEIKNEWESLQTLDAKNHYKARRRIGYDVVQSYYKNKSEIGIEQLEFYIRSMKSVIDQKHLYIFTKDWIKLATGNNDEPKIISKLSSKVPVDTGSISVADLTYYEPDVLSTLDDDNMLYLLNQGKCYTFGTSADGIFNVQLRVIDYLEPILTSKECKYIDGSTESAVIHVPTGNVIVADPYYDLSDNNRYMSINVTPGNYKICTHLFCTPGKFDSFYIVLCKTNQEASNSFSVVPALD